jgi:hypothetical protein
MKNIKKLAVMLLALPLVYSCDKTFDDNFNTSYPDKTVGFNYAATQPINILAVSPPSGGGDLTLDFGKIFLSAPEPADADITVKIRLNNTLIADYNNTNGTNFVAPPAAALVMPLSYTIPRGTREVTIPAALKLALIDLANSYAIGLTVESVSGVGGVNINRTYENMLFGLIIKNQYDGLYRVKGYGDHPNPALTGPFSLTPCSPGWFSLATSGANSVDLKPGQPTTNGGATTYFTTVVPRFSVDPATRAVTVIGGATGNAVTYDPQPGYNSRYDVPSKTFFVKLGWLGSRIYTDTLIYCGPRP